MARLIIRVAPNHQDRSQPGDVIEVMEDSHVFSFAEMNNGQYNIVEMPGVPAATLMHRRRT